LRRTETRHAGADGDIVEVGDLNVMTPGEFGEHSGLANRTIAP